MRLQLPHEMAEGTWAVMLSSSVNDYMKQLWQEPAETETKGNKRTPKQGQETNSDGSSFC